MHDRRDGGHDRRGPRDQGCCDDRDFERRGGHGRPDREDDCRGERGPRDHHHHHHHHDHHHCGGEHGERRGGGPDTRFLQLEMSQLLYAGAESVTRDAFREVLLEAAKARLRERFGDKIAGLAQLAVDELLNDVLSSLEIEARIHERNRERGRTQERLREIFADRGAGREEEDGCEGEPPCHDEGGEGGASGPGDDEER